MLFSLLFSTYFLVEQRHKTFFDFISGPFKKAYVVYLQLICPAKLPHCDTFGYDKSRILKINDLKEIELLQSTKIRHLIDVTYVKLGF